MVSYSRATSYFAVLTVVVGSVAFGLDWQPAPMSPMPENKVVATAMPPAIPVSSTPVATPHHAPAPVAVAPIAKTPSQPKCDVSACAHAYRTFRESDCTYKPNFGPRRLCTKGASDGQAAAPNNPAVAVIPPAATPPTIAAAPQIEPPVPQIIAAENLSGLIEQGVEYNRRNDYARALAVFNQVIRLDGNSTAAFYQRAAVYYNMGDYDRAIQDYDRVLRVEPQNNLAALFRSMAYDKKNPR